MSKRLDVRIWSIGALVPMILAGCAASSPTTAPMKAPAQKASFHTQSGWGGQGGTSAPSAIYGVDGLGLFSLEYLSSHPMENYSWYQNRGNFGTFGWAPNSWGTSGWCPGYSSASYGNMMYYPLGNTWIPYSYNSYSNAWYPYSYQGYYPYLYNSSPYYTYGNPFWQTSYYGYGNEGNNGGTMNNGGTNGGNVNNVGNNNNVASNNNIGNVSNVGNVGGSVGNVGSTVGSTLGGVGIR